MLKYPGLISPAVGYFVKNLSDVPGKINSCTSSKPNVKLVTGSLLDLAIISLKVSVHVSILANEETIPASYSTSSPPKPLGFT